MCMHRPKIIVLILAAGAARRMNQAKMLLPFEHSTILQSIIEKAKEIGRSEVKEVVLTGINLGDFGYGTNENFFQLIIFLIIKIKPSPKALK